MDVLVEPVQDLPALLRELVVAARQVDQRLDEVGQLASGRDAEVADAALVRALEDGGRDAGDPERVGLGKVRPSASASTRCRTSTAWEGVR